MQRIIVLLSLAVVLCLSASGVAKTNVDIVWDMQNNFNELFAAVNAELSPSFALELGVSTEGHMQSGASQTFAVQQAGFELPKQLAEGFCRGTAAAVQPRRRHRGS